MAHECLMDLHRHCTFAVYRCKQNKLISVCLLTRRGAVLFLYTSTYSLEKDRHNSIHHREQYIYNNSVSPKIHVYYIHINTNYINKISTTLTSSYILDEQEEISVVIVHLICLAIRFDVHISGSYIGRTYV